MSGDYWIWRSDIYDEQQLVVHRPSKFIHESEVVFDEGSLIPRSSVPDPLELVPRPGDTGSLTDNLPAPGIRGLLVSGRVRSLLEYEGIDNVQYFRIDSALGQDSPPPAGYFVANIIGRIRCVDLDESEISMVDDEIHGVDRLELRPEAAHALDVFRLEALPSVVVVSDRIKNAMVSARITGVTFCEPSEFTY